MTVNNGDIAAIYARADRREQIKVASEDHSRFTAPSRPGVEGLTKQDNKDLAKADQAHARALALPRINSQRAAKLDRAVADKKAVLDRIANRAVGASVHVALQEAAHLEALRGGKVVAGNDRGDSHRQRKTADGLDFLVASDVPPAVKRSFKRYAVAGMMYRSAFEEHEGSGIRCQIEPTNGGGVVAAKSAAEDVIASKVDAASLLAKVERRLGKTSRGLRELRVLNEVAGRGRSLASVAPGGRNTHLAKLALMRALDVVAIVLRLP